MSGSEMRAIFDAACDRPDASTADESAHKVGWFCEKHLRVHVRLFTDEEWAKLTTRVAEIGKDKP